MMKTLILALVLGQSMTTPQSDKPPREDVYGVFRGLETTFILEHKPDFFERDLGQKTKTIYDQSKYITVIYCGYSDKDKDRLRDFGSINYILFSNERPEITTTGNLAKPKFLIKVSGHDESATLFTTEVVWVKDGKKNFLTSLQSVSSGTYARQSSYPFKWLKTWTSEDLAKWFAVR